VGTKLEKLLDDIRPEKVIVRTFDRANQAINSYRIDRAQIKDLDHFKDIMGRFVRHIDLLVLRLRTPMDVSPDEYWSRFAEDLLRGVYGPSGTKTAFEMARTGSGGGLYKVLRAVAMHAAEDYAKREIQARVNAFWESLSIDEQLEACSEYLANYGPLLPQEMTERSAGRIRAAFNKVLERHPWTLLKTHEVGR
jgi:hypothetical protein